MAGYVRLFTRFLARGDVGIAAAAYFAVATPAFLALGQVADPASAPTRWWLAQEALSLLLACAFQFAIVRRVLRDEIGVGKARLGAFVLLVIAGQALAYVMAYAMVIAALHALPGLSAWFTPEDLLYLFFGIAAAVLLPLSIWQFALLSGHGWPGLVASWRLLRTRQGAYLGIFAISAADFVIGWLLGGLIAVMPYETMLAVTMVPYTIFLAANAMLVSALLADMIGSNPGLGEVFA